MLARIPVLALAMALLSFMPVRYELERTSPYAAEVVGAWQLQTLDGEPFQDQLVKIVSDEFFMVTQYNLDSKTFVGTSGGTFQFDGNTLTESTEFNTWEADDVGNSHSYQATIEGDIWTVKGEKTFVWKRIDKGSNESAPLAGAWRIRERERQGQMTTMRRGPRKTIKILSATRFQWTAFNTETKQFMGTGGGTYTSVDGKYTENIEFFSRDSSRVGAKLTFDFEVNNGDWHHKGMSSRGSPIYEIWALEH